MSRLNGDKHAAWLELKCRLRNRLLTRVDLEAITTPAETAQSLRMQHAAQEHVRRVVLEGLAHERDVKLTAPARERMIAELTNELMGYGPIAPLLQDTTVTEIMVNGPSSVFVERAGRVEPTKITFRNEEHLRFCIERMLDPLGLSVNESEPFVDASLSDGSRLNIVIPPLALDGPIVTIRKQLIPFTLEKLVTFHALTDEVAEFLKACVQARVNILISGGTSTGKTTLGMVLSAFIGPEERVMTIENVPELQLVHTDHWLRLVARPPNIEGRGEITVRQLVKNALRMRPDRIILGEARGAEALDMIQAMHTGHEGFFTLIHGNAPEAALERLETLMLMSDVALSPRACRQQIASAIELIVHLSRCPDGSRRVTHIAQVAGVTEQGFLLEELATFHVEPSTTPEVFTGQLRPTGCRPKFLDKLTTHQVPLPRWVLPEGVSHGR